MTASVASTAAQAHPTASAASPKEATLWLTVALQLSLAELLLASFWFLLGPEAQTSWVYRWRLFAIGAGACLSCGLWIAHGSWPPVVKWLSIAACAIACLAWGNKSARDFDVAVAVLAAGRVCEGRVRHEALGVSYAAPPEARIMLEPLITKQLGDRGQGGRSSPTRLRYGEMAILTRMVWPSQSAGAGRSPTSIIMEVQLYAGADDHELLVNVRQNQEKCAAAGLRITRPVHLTKVAGAAAVEFDFEDEQSHLFARQIFLRSGPFGVNFMLNSSDPEVDRRMFDEFLNSIRLEPAGK